MDEYKRDNHGCLVHREVFFSAFSSKPPWSCDFCGKEIRHTGHDKDALVVHHKDEIRTNNNITNLSAMHFACHGLHHGSLRTPEMVEASAAKNRGKTRSQDFKDEASLRASNRSVEHQSKLNASNTGQKRTDESRKKMSVAKLGKPSAQKGKPKHRYTCEDCGGIFGGGWVVRHKNNGGCV